MAGGRIRHVIEGKPAVEVVYDLQQLFSRPRAPARHPCWTTSSKEPSVSFLTKLFVVLLVVLSMLLTAGLIVFVQKTENVNREYVQLQGQYADRERELRAGKAQVAALTTEKQQQTIQIYNLNTATQSAQTNADRILADKDVQIQRLNEDKGSLALQNTALASALKASEDQKAQQRDELAALRKTADDLTRKNADANVGISALTSLQEATERDRRFALERNVQLQMDLSTARDQLQRAGISLTEKRPVGPTALTINGVVRTTKTIGGILYATISIGSSDSVAKGMQFNVLNRDQGQWLGTLTVDSVEPNEATGRLDLKSPEFASQIKPNRTEVRTQF
jgi:hypothetical protein